MKIIEIIILFIPILSGFITARLCPIDKSSGNNVSFRPPSFMFGIVWPILYILLGMAWIYSSRINKYVHILYLLLNILLCLWIFIYNCKNDPVKGVWILMVCILACVYCIIIGPQISRYLIAPLLVWLLFATSLNMFQLK